MSKLKTLEVLPAVYCNRWLSRPLIDSQEDIFPHFTSLHQRIHLQHYPRQPTSPHRLYTPIRRWLVDSMAPMLQPDALGRMWEGVPKDNHHGTVDEV